MVSQEALQTSNSNFSTSPDRNSFSSEFVDGKNLISAMSPNHRGHKEHGRAGAGAVDFEFLSRDLTDMITADELFCEGKLLPFWQARQAEKLDRITLRSENAEMGSQETAKITKNDASGFNFLDDDPSPRPPTCNVLWKELLRLRKHRPSTDLSPSSSSSSSMSSKTSTPPLGGESKDEISENKEKNAMKRSKKRGLERSRSSSSMIRIRPVINVPLYAHQRKSVAFHHLFHSRKTKIREVKNIN